MSQSPGEASATASRILVAALVAVFVGTAHAAAQAPSPSPTLSLGDLGVKGHAIFKNFSHFREAPLDNRNFREEGILQLEWTRKLAEWAEAKVVGEAREDDDRFAQDVTFRIPETMTHRSVLGLKEAALTLRPGGGVDVSLGKQIFAWGTADFYNPTDNLNPYDFLDPIDNEKMGVYSVASRLTVGPSSLVFVIVPVFTPSRSPFGKSRWTPVPDSPVIVDSREVPEPALDNIQYATRARTTLAGWDVSASYYDGFENTAVLRSVPDDQLHFTPVFTRQKVAGLDFSTTFGKLEWHTEGVFKLVQRNGRHDRFQGITGVNYTWDEIGLKWLDQIALIFEYARETILTSTRRPIVEPTGLRAFQDTLASRLQFKFTEETQVKLVGALDLATSPSHYFQAKVAHKLSDALHVEGGVDFFAGLRETFYGRWKDNDRFTFMAKYYF